MSRLFANMASIGLSVQVAQAVPLVGPRRPLAAGRFVTTREVWVDTGPSLPLDLDGEVRGRTPVRITLLPQALRVLVPDGFVRG